MQLEDSYINISLMSVLLFNLQREVQRWRSAPAGPAAASPGIRPRCWLDLVEPGLRHRGRSRGAPPAGATLHADLPAGSLAFSKHSNLRGRAGAPLPLLSLIYPHPQFQLCGGRGGGQRQGPGACLLLSLFKNENL